MEWASDPSHALLVGSGGKISVTCWVHEVTELMEPIG